MHDAQTHWTNVYKTKAANDVSWYQVHPERSLAFFEGAGVALNASIIDVGAGTSTLVDHLVTAGYKDITLLDISQTAMDIVRARLENASDNITWITGDITTVTLPHHHYDVWHDRALFHFLADPLHQKRYVEQVFHAVKPGGHVIIATFAADGPEQCSGLETSRYDVALLYGVLGNRFRLVESRNETHLTPWGSEQRFIYCHFSK